MACPSAGSGDEPFASTDAIFEYAAQCRLFVAYLDGSSYHHHHQQGEDGSDADGTKKLTSGDRRRMNTRPLFRRWIDDFVPRCRATATAATTATMTREEMRAEVFARFPAAGVEYAATLRIWRGERQAEQVWTGLIKGRVPTNLDPQYRGLVCSALRKIILRGDTSFGIVPSASLRAADGEWLMDEVGRFVDANWQAVGVVASRIQHDQYLESKKRKAAASS